MRPRFVVVDDSRAIQAIIKRSIIAAGYGETDVVSVATGDAALGALEATLPDLLITDWHMPSMSGLELLQTVRQKHGTQLKVGLVTTEMNPELLRQARQSGAEFILHKPFHDSELRENIRRAVGPPGGEVDDTPASEESSSPDHTEALRELLAATLGPIKFRLIPQPPAPLNTLTSTLLLCLYVLPEVKAPHALGLMEISTVCMVGGGALGLPPAQVRPAIAAGVAPAAMIERASAFMGDAAAAVLRTPEGEVPLMQRGTVVSRDLDRLQHALMNSRDKRSFRLQIPGYGEGRLAFVTL
jgi:CheY-like chemotaxis protein